MGTDIHVTIEHQDTQGHWWTLMGKAVYWTEWWSVHVRGMPAGDDRYQHPAFFKTTAVSQSWARDIVLFSTLSNVRGQNRLAGHVGLDTPKGLANIEHQRGVWPQNVSHAARYRYASQDYHSHGVCTFSDLDRLLALLSTHKQRLSNEQRAQQKSLARWASDLDACLAVAFGDGDQKSPLDRPFMRLDHEDDTDAPVDLFAPVGAPSAHAYISYLEERRRISGWRAVPRDRLRVLVCYDS